MYTVNKVALKNSHIMPPTGQKTVACVDSTQLFLVQRSNNFFYQGESSANLYTSLQVSPVSLHKRNHRTEDKSGNHRRTSKVAQPDKAFLRVVARRVGSYAKKEKLQVSLYCPKQAQCGFQPGRSTIINLTTSSVGCARSGARLA